MLSIISVGELNLGKLQVEDTLKVLAKNTDIKKMISMASKSIAFENRLMTQLMTETKLANQYPVVGPNTFDDSVAAYSYALIKAKPEIRSLVRGALELSPKLKLASWITENA